MSEIMDLTYLAAYNNTLDTYMGLGITIGVLLCLVVGFYIYAFYKTKKAEREKNKAFMEATLCDKCNEKYKKIEKHLT